MKKIGYIVLLAILTSVSGIAQEINWVTFDKALELQKKKPKKIMMDVYTNWCGPCKMLDKYTFKNKDLAAYVNKNYYAVKFNAEGNGKVNYKGKIFSNPNYNPKLASRRNSSHELSSYLQVNAYPTIIFMDEKADLLAPVTGYQKPKDLELYLKLFNGNEYKNINTQEKFEAYSATFKSEFKS